MRIWHALTAVLRRVSATGVSAWFQRVAPGRGRDARRHKKPANRRERKCLRARSLSSTGPSGTNRCGGVLFSRSLAAGVPSALAGLASGFGMGPGVSLAAITTDTCVSGMLPAVVWWWVGWVLASGCEWWRFPSLPGPAPWWGGLVGGGCAGFCWFVLVLCVSFGLLVPVSSSPVARFPLLVYQPHRLWGALSRVGGRPGLGEGFPLRCFQRLSRPDVASQPCTWRYNWSTRGPSVPVLSY
jgi:hypothetical protein